MYYIRITGQTGDPSLENGRNQAGQDTTKLTWLEQLGLGPAAGVSLPDTYCYHMSSACGQSLLVLKCHLCYLHFIFFFPNSLVANHLFFNDFLKLLNMNTLNKSKSRENINNEIQSDDHISLELSALSIISIFWQVFEKFIGILLNVKY